MFSTGDKWNPAHSPRRGLRSPLLQQPASNSYYSFQYRDFSIYDVKVYSRFTSNPKRGARSLDPGPPTRALLLPLTFPAGRQAHVQERVLWGTRASPSSTRVPSDHVLGSGGMTPYR